MTTVTRYHDISCGHRVVGHEGKCRFFHGHNYRIHFTLEPGSYGGVPGKLDDIGRVMDFSVIKSKLCMWLEENWDHKFLMWDNDPMLEDMPSESSYIKDTLGIITVPFNPTAENIAKYLVTTIGPKQLEGTNVRLLGVEVEETRKCSASYTIYTGTFI